ncbi:hypothetical protein M0R45_008596 [Rubus argutus]|uniref:HVA22-like protein n=1 Tax=Rubus argutus TaxID=59490 RepID=A0AAW1Y4I8_RUBAR
MGLLDLLEFALKCFDVLAWPLFALVYPLYSTIRAIEANSITDTLKLNTYWVVFSLILLFEHVFMKLLEWFPLWQYIRLLIVIVSTESNLDVKEFNAVSSMENKASLSIKPNEGHKDIKAVYVMAKKKETTANQVSQVEPNMTGTEDRFSAMKINEKAVEVAADVETLETPLSRKVLIGEWTCTVPIQTDTTFISPVGVKKHKAVNEALKLKKETEPKLTQD